MMYSKDMATRTLTAVTEYGTFSRKTDHEYSHIVVILPIQADVDAANAAAVKAAERLEWARQQPLVTLPNTWERTPAHDWIKLGGGSYYRLSGFEKDARDTRRRADNLAKLVACGHGTVSSWHSRRDLAESAASQLRQRSSLDGRTILVLPVEAAVTVAA